MGFSWRAPGDCACFGRAIPGAASAKGRFAVLLPRSLGGRDAAAEPTGMCLLASPGKQDGEAAEGLAQPG